MKRIIAAMMILAMVMCGTAFAKSAAVESISKNLGYSASPIGYIGIIEAAFGAEVPCRTMTGIVFKEGGYYIELKEADGKNYGWHNDTEDFFSSARTVSAALGAAFEVGYVDGSLFIFNDCNAPVFGLAPYADEDENFYNDAEDFVNAIAIQTCILQEEQ